MKENIDSIKEKLFSLLEPSRVKYTVLTSDVLQIFQDPRWIPRYVREQYPDPNVGLVNRVAQSPLNVQQFGLFGRLHTARGHPYYSVSDHEAPAPYYFGPAIEQASSIGLSPNLIKAGLGVHDLKKRAFTHVADQDPLIIKLRLDHHSALRRALETPEIASAIEEEYHIDSSQLLNLGPNDPHVVAFNQLEDLTRGISEGPISGIVVSESQKKTLPGKVQILSDGTPSLSGRFVFYIENPPEALGNVGKYLASGPVLQYVSTFLQRLDWADCRKEKSRVSALEKLVLRHLGNVMEENEFIEMIDSPEGEKAIFKKVRELKGIDDSYPIQCLNMYLDNPQAALSYLPEAVWGCVVAPYGERWDWIYGNDWEEVLSGKKSAEFGLSGSRTTSDMERITEEMFDIEVTGGGHFSVIPGVGRKEGRGKLVETYPTVTLLAPALFMVYDKAVKRNPLIVSKIRERKEIYYRDIVIRLDEAFRDELGPLRKIFDLAYSHHARELRELREERISRTQERFRPTISERVNVAQILRPPLIYDQRQLQRLLPTLSPRPMPQPQLQIQNIQRDKHGRVRDRSSWVQRRERNE